MPREIIPAGAVRLRRWRPDDAGECARLVAESAEHLAPAMPWVAAYRDDPEKAAAEYLERCDYEWANDLAYNYAVVADGTIVGSISLMRRVGPGGLEIGYWLHVDRTGRGFATAAAKALVKEAFQQNGVMFVDIQHGLDNDASAAIPRRLGFAKVGTRKFPGEDRVGIVWRLEKDAAPVAAFFAAMESGAIDDAVALVTDDLVWRNTNLPTLRGANRLRTSLTQLRRLGVRLSAEFTEVSVEGAEVTSERIDHLRFGKLHMTFGVHGEFELRDGRIAEWRDRYSRREVAAAFFASLRRGV